MSHLNLLNMFLHYIYNCSNVISHLAYSTKDESLSMVPLQPYGTRGDMSTNSQCLRLYTSFPTKI